MKRTIRLLIAIVMFMSIPMTAGAGEYKSNFGFTGTLSDKWVVQTADMLKNNKNLFSSPELRGLGEHLVENIVEFVSKGKFELVYRDSNDDKYSDNMYVFLISPTRLNLKNTVKECGEFKTHIQRQYKRDVYNEVYSCGFEDSETLPILKIVYDGYVIGTKSTSYRFFTPKGTSQIVATCKNKRCETTFKEIETMLKNLK